MSEPSKSSGSGIGCLAIPLWALLIAILSGAWLWSGGMGAREAVAAGLAYGAYGAGFICMLPLIVLVLIVLCAIGFALVAKVLGHR